MSVSKELNTVFENLWNNKSTLILNWVLGLL